MNPKLSSKYIYENSADVFIDDKSVESAAELVVKIIIQFVCIIKQYMYSCGVM